MTDSFVWEDNESPWRFAGPAGVEFRTDGFVVHMGFPVQILAVSRPVYRAVLYGQSGPGRRRRGHAWGRALHRANRKHRQAVAWATAAIRRS